MNEVRNNIFNFQVTPVYLCNISLSCSNLCFSTRYIAGFFKARKSGTHCELICTKQVLIFNIRLLNVLTNIMHWFRQGNWCQNRKICPHTSNREGKKGQMQWCIYSTCPLVQPWNRLSAGAPSQKHKLISARRNFLYQALVYGVWFVSFIHRKMVNYLHSDDFLYIEKCSLHWVNLLIMQYNHCSYCLNILTTHFVEIMIQMPFYY